MKKSLRIGISLLVAFTLMISSTIGVFGKVTYTGDDTYSYKYDHCYFGYVLNYGDAVSDLKKVHKFQSIAFDKVKDKNNKDVTLLYVSARYAEDGKTDNDMVILQFIVNGVDANYTGNRMFVRNAGHAETLDIYNHTLMFGVNAESKSGKYFSKEIGFSKFDNGKTKEYSKINKVTDFQYMNQSKKSWGEVKRVAAACSDSYVCVRAEIGNGYYYAKYDRSKFFNKNKSAQKIDCKSFYHAKTVEARGTGWGSFQSMECTENGNIYISSGFHVGENPFIGKKDITSKKLAHKAGRYFEEVYKNYRISNTKERKANEKERMNIYVDEWETEGLDIFGKYVYFMSAKTVNGANRFFINRISKFD